MSAIQRLLATAIGVGFVLAGSVITASAADRPAKATPRQAPKIYLVSPNSVNLRTQPNIILTGQNLAATTQVAVGGRPATTLEAPDPNHLLVQLPADLHDGSYTLTASNGDQSATADDLLIIQAASPLDRNTMLIVIGGIALLLLAARLARFQTFE
jgi:hypothetical protein